MLDRNSLILADGAMGTYVAMLGGRDCACELNNILNPNKIKQIHSEYIAAGAKLIRTNTFSANTYLLNDSWDKVAQVIAAGFSIAKSVAGLQDIIIAADIGPIPSELRQEEIYDEYKKIVDLFFEQGADTFLFETFSSTDYLDEIAAYIKGKSATATVITSFSLTPDGVTKNGTSAQELIDWKLSVPQIDILGFNCGSGPAHMRKTLNALQTKGCRLSLMPNAGYAQVNIDSGISYANHADYFARTLIDMINADTVIVGGCCGTTPEHICRISKILSRNYNKSRAKAVTEAESPSAVKPKENIIKNKLSNREFIITVEVEPPKDSDASR
ncbi:MAG TPA: homocysteine S-methyltransferase family protein, partial [Clostridia bacterium]|nr:homocysteine S-methyltransferase family protein [Clostridia bacterium]